MTHADVKTKQVAKSVSYSSDLTAKQMMSLIHRENANSTIYREGRNAEMNYKRNKGTKVTFSRGEDVDLNPEQPGRHLHISNLHVRKTLKVTQTMNEQG